MQISVTNAKALLTELVRRAEAGDDVVLTRHGQPMVRLVPIRPAATSARRRSVLETVRAQAARKLVQEGAGAGAVAGTGTAARSQDFLYGESGLPE